MKGLVYNFSMEILELIFGLIQLAGCCVEAGAGLSSVGAGVSGAKAYQRRQDRKEAKETGQPDVPGNPYFWTFLLLLFAAFFLVGALVWKWIVP